MKKKPFILLSALVMGSVVTSGAARADDIFVSNNGGSSVEEISNGGTPTPFIDPTSDLYGPTGLAIDSAGNVYVANNGQIGAGFVAEFSSTGTFEGNVATNLNNPRGMAFDSAGNLFVANQSSGTITEIPTGNGTPTTVVSGLSFPNGLTFDSAGNLYVTNAQSDSIDKITFSGGSVSAVTPFVTTGLDNPIGLVYDTVGANAGNFFVINNGDSVMEFDSSGAPVAPTPFITDLNASDDARGITVDSAGNFWVSDNGDNTVTEYNSLGAIIDVYNQAGAFDGPCYIIAAAAVPEPSTYLLLTAGLGFLLFLARRKKVTV